MAHVLIAKSREGEKLPMTVPVMQDGGDPMASDPPLFDDDLEGAWRTRFVMPPGRAADDLPALANVSSIRHADRRVVPLLGVHAARRRRPRPVRLACRESRSARSQVTGYGPVG